MEVHVKICGITSVADARMCLDAGASAIGLNFIPTSPRTVEVGVARAIASCMAGKILVVGVVADLSLDAMRALREAVPLGCLQLHGDEPEATLAALLPHAYKAIRIGDAKDVARADAYPGAHVLVDAKVDGLLGGTGQKLDPRLVVDLARRRKLTLAGGLTPENVADAVRLVRPYCVDVASGVEIAPGRKDPDKVLTFVQSAHAAAASVAP